MRRVLIAYVNSEVSGKPANPRSHARAFAVRLKGTRGSFRQGAGDLAPLHDKIPFMNWLIYVFITGCDIICWFQRLLQREVRAGSPLPTQGTVSPRL